MRARTRPPEPPPGSRPQSELASIHARLQRALRQRRTLRRLLLASRSAATPTAQQEFWLEFVRAHRQYRSELQQLAAFCHPRPGGAPEVVSGALPGKKTL
ncbi:MAG: hypothetical protein JO341_08295 [Gammaproteobacteria bacterium]|nr:hypothetical protein [Gammaproteobacteria bacterium]MBV9621011.1 hypothetical protein [Gammaproteobacteria bacterium]